MKALTIWQPWAGIVAAGIKRNETRNWGTNYRGRIAIHAAKQDIHIGWCRYLSDEAAEVICRRLDLPEVFNAVEAFPTGCVLATANLVECIKITPEFIATLSPDDPIPARGRQGLWEWEGMQ